MCCTYQSVYDIHFSTELLFNKHQKHLYNCRSPEEVPHVICLLFEHCSECHGAMSLANAYIMNVGCTSYSFMSTWSAYTLLHDLVSRFSHRRGIWFNLELWQLTVAYSCSFVFSLIILYNRRWSYVVFLLFDLRSYTILYAFGIV